MPSCARPIVAAVHGPKPYRNRLLRPLLAGVALLLAVPAGATWSVVRRVDAELVTSSADQPTRREALGRALFMDTSLSEPLGTSCASCHEPQAAFCGNHGS